MSIASCSRFSLLLFLIGGLLGGLLLGSSPVFAQVPRVLHYQATLADGDFPVEGTVDLTVSFYADPTGGSPLAGWEEEWTDVPVTEGRVSLLLGSQTLFPDVLFDASSLYLEVVVNEEVLPRLQVGSSAYALRAGLAEGVAPDAITAPALANGAITTRALADGAVTTLVLADAAVTTAKLAAGAVATSSLADGAVTSSKLGQRAVVGSVLADGAVTSTKLANGAVTASKVATGELVSSVNDLTDAVRLVAGENVSITPNADAGTITISATDDDSFPSSRRWKTNVQSLDGLALVQQLRGVRYEWIESGTPDVGLIAEDVGAVVPEVVTYAPNGVDAESVNYAKLVALLVEAVKAQQSQIEADRLLLKELQRRLTALERAPSE